MKADPKDRLYQPPERDTFLGTRGWLVLGGIAITLVVGALTVSAFWRDTYVVPDDVALRLDAGSQLAAKRLILEPCNQALAAQLVRALEDSADYQAVIAFVESSRKKCASNDFLLLSLYRSQFFTSDLAGAEQTLDELIEKFPADPSVFVSRSDAREKRGNVTGAYQDMARALSLFTDPSKLAAQSYLDVGRLATKAGRPCEGAATLRDFIAYDPPTRRTPPLVTLMRDWQKLGSCPSIRGSGSARLKYDTQASAIVMSVDINGEQARMIVDTGASRTVLSKQFAQRAGVNASDLDGDTATTANGTIWVAGGRVRYISLGDARLNDAPVFIQNGEAGFGDGIDGLLGLSFLGNFRVHIGEGKFELDPLE